MAPMAPNFAECGGQVQSFDDGHVPENLPPKTETSLVHYPHFFNPPPAIHVFHDALPSTLVDALYERTEQQQMNFQTPWGTYVTIQQVQEYWKNGNSTSTNDNNIISEADTAVQAVAHFLQLALGLETPEKTPSQRHTLDDSTTTLPEKNCPLWTSEDLNLAHGVAVWALAGKEGSQVPYHLDYAEQIRYETNVIVPPLLAGTLQCTRDRIEGGNFEITLGGLEHYQQYGYKGKRCTDSIQEMISIPYRYNQLMCHSGQLPHASTLIEKIHGDQLRVIVGFNVFAHDIGPLVEQAPEHSDSFRRKVQLQRLYNQPDQKVSLESIRQNKPLSKLLVLAKRERVKLDFLRAREYLKELIPSRLPATVQELMDHFGKENGTWPAPVDVQVYLYHQVLEGSLRVISNDLESSAPNKQDLVSPLATLDIVEDQ
jgi:hypothetical protein